MTTPAGLGITTAAGFDACPAVAIFNNLENQYPFLSRGHDEALIERMHRRGERALFWLGADKLVFLSSPPAHSSYVRDLGYTGTLACVPKTRSTAICQDILADPELLELLVNYAGPGKTLSLVPYVTTPAFIDLAAALRQAYGLTVLLPESPTPANLWLRDYADRKSGFRQLASELGVSAKFPDGFACRDASEAKAAAAWFGGQGRTCIAKADTGNSGFGHLVLEPNADGSCLDADPFLQDGIVIVEEVVSSSEFPSVEVFVPAAGGGDVRVTYVCLQIIQGSHFAGVIIGPEQRTASWYGPLVEAGLAIGARLQNMGYVGYFDVDAVVDQAGQPLLLELNARRTGGTHAHEFGCFSLGSDYGAHAALICHAELPCPAVASFEELRGRLEPLLYPIAQQRRGIVITNTPAPEDRTFGCIVVGESSRDALALQETMLTRLA